MATNHIIEDHPEPGDVAFLEEQINEYNFAATGYRDGRDLGIFVRDDSGAIVAGLWGWTWGGCLQVQFLWVQESRRKLGEGSELLAAAEHEARRRGCVVAVVDTHSFQAPGFYPRFGYERIGTVEGYPRGHAQHYFRKDL